MPAAVELASRVTELIGTDLAAAETIFDAEVSSSQPCVIDLIEHIRRYRGKRLRPMLLFLAAKACGELTAKHHTLAAVVEMIHTATLVHDDVLDEAETRRHVATVNTRWNTETSVLLGDYLFTHAFHLAATTGSAEACRLIGEATNRVCEGELAQVHSRGNWELTEREYFEIIEAKTAALLELSARLGGMFAGAKTSVVEQSARFGRLVGIAFQIADDLLDLTGDEQIAGKSLGRDLEAEKLTLPVIRALSAVPAREAERVRERLTAGESIFDLLPQAALTAGVESTRVTAHGLITEAQALLRSLPDSPATELLRDVAEFSLSREH